MDYSLEGRVRNNGMVKRSFLGDIRNDNEIEHALWRIRVRSFDLVGLLLRSDRSDNSMTTVE